MEAAGTVQAVKGKTDGQPKKNVSFFLPEDHTPIPTPCPIRSQAAKQRQEDSIISQLQVTLIANVNSDFIYV